MFAGFLISLSSIWSCILTWIIWKRRQLIILNACISTRKFLNCYAIDGNEKHVLKLL